MCCRMKCVRQCSTKWMSVSRAFSTVPRACQPPTWFGASESAAPPPTASSPSNNTASSPSGSTGTTASRKRIASNVINNMLQCPPIVTCCDRGFKEFISPRSLEIRSALLRPEPPPHWACSSNMVAAIDALPLQQQYGCSNRCTKHGAAVWLQQSMHWACSSMVVTVFLQPAHQLM